MFVCVKEYSKLPAPSKRLVDHLVRDPSQNAKAPLT
jgi:hypothetical protein